jgi:hypothetical protein
MNPENPTSASSTAVPSNPPPQESSQSTSDEEQNKKSTLDFINEYTSRVDDLEKRLDDDESKIEETKSQNIETLGLFVALFTFISVEFSLFKELTDFNMTISLTLIIAGLLIFFVLLLHNVVRTANSHRWWLFYLVLFVVAVSLVGFGIYFPYSKIDKFLTRTQPAATSSATLQKNSLGN